MINDTSLLMGAIQPPRSWMITEPERNLGVSREQGPHAVSAVLQL